VDRIWALFQASSCPDLLTQPAVSSSFNNSNNNDYNSIGINYGSSGAWQFATGDSFCKFLLSELKFSFKFIFLNDTPTF
jgi:hypothetical protein